MLIPSSPRGARVRVRQPSLAQDGDSELVDSLWTYRSPTSLDLVRHLIATRPTSCVRLRVQRGTMPQAGAAAAAARGGEHATIQAPSGSATHAAPAVAWALQYGDGSIGMAHTLQAHRRRGLMRVAAADLVARVLAAGRQPEAYA